MSFKRQDIKEEYNVTADWLQDFARELEKKSYNIENLTNIRQMTDSSKKFATIEEKMADIKARIGFDAINSMHEETSKKTASESHDCGCGGHDEESCACDVEIKTASDKKHKKEDLEAMSNIIKYIQDLCKHEHEKLTPIMVISKCRDESGLRFDELPINMEELKSFVSDTLDKYITKDEDVRYVPRDEMDGDNPNKEPEYMSHAFPQNG